MNQNSSIFIELLQVALGSRTELTRMPSDVEWKELFATAQKQAVAALILPVVDSMTAKGLRLPQQIVIEWIGISEQTVANNKVVNQRCLDISQLFTKAGFRTCILKGQGNGLFYDNPLVRAPGDIDIWVDADRKSITNFVKERFPDAEESNLHIDYPVFNDVPVEVHYRPTMARSYKYDMRLQSFYDTWADECFANKVSLGGGSVCVPVPELNVVMQLSHVMNHFFEEGIGLRHVVDYFYLLKNTGFDRPKMGNKIASLGMGKFNRAMMWVLHHELGLEEKYLTAKPDKKRGVLLMNEIMVGGNLGRYDQRFKKLYKKSPLVYKIARNARFTFLFPMESFLSPLVAKIYRKR